MRLVTFRHDSAARLGAVVGDLVVDLAALALADKEKLPADMLVFIEQGQTALETAWSLLRRYHDRWPDGTTAPLTQCLLLAPIPRPRKNIICLGLNYAEHLQEGNVAQNIQRDLPTAPIYFSKAPTCVVGPEQPIVLDPGLTSMLDWEAELAVILDRDGTRIAKDDALGHVFGYTCFNDVSARDLQRARGGQWHLGKSLNTTGPMGPWIVTADEIPDPQNLRITLRVNGVTKQDSNTRFMIFDVATCIADWSAGITLEAGDVIATGTPNGVGYARTPPEFLQPGDVVEVEIEKIGVLRNTVKAYEAAPVLRGGPVAAESGE